VSNPNRGPVIAQPNVIAVMWTGDVDPAVRDGIGGFYSTLLSSDYMTWLAEYDIQHGTYGGVYTISPSNQNPTLDRVEIRAELEARIAAGDLPPRQDNTVYAVHFPRDYTLTVALASGNKRSCDDFCGFHDSFRPQGTADPIRYTAVADQNCSRCIVGSSLFDAATVVSSHEIAEAVTNPDPDLSSSWKVRAAPGTVDPKNDLEIADLCQ